MEAHLTWAVEPHVFFFVEKKIIRSPPSNQTWLDEQSMEIPMDKKSIYTTVSETKVLLGESWMNEDTR